MRTGWWMVGAAMVVGTLGQAAEAPRASVGHEAPMFSLPDSKGGKQDLQSVRGKYVVLEWVNYDCPFVGKHYGSGNMQELQRTYTGKGVVWYSICSSAPGKQGNFTPDEVNARMQDLKAAPTAYLVDAGGTVGQEYGARTTPHIFIIDPKGMLVYAGGIDDRATTDKEDIPRARNYVRDVLDAALAGKPVPVTSSRSYGCSVKY